jgi:HAD superfamily hydrolase (TIGR01509 family)
MRALLFDWGNTLMRDFPDFRGPMAYWPRVEAMPGAPQTLARLRREYRVVVATNAADSGRVLVQAALARVGLLPYVDEVFTGHELRLRKPDPAFFHAIADRLGRPVGEMVMIGDDYPADVVGAKLAGLRAVWYNPEGMTIPPPVKPCHDAEIGRLCELPEALKCL